MKYVQTYHIPKLNTTYEMQNGCRHTVIGIVPIIFDWEGDKMVEHDMRLEVIQHGRPSPFKVDATEWHLEPKRKLTRIQKGKLTKASRFAVKRNLEFDEGYISKEDRVLLAMISKEFKQLAGNSSFGNPTLVKKYLDPVHPGRGDIKFEKPHQRYVRPIADFPPCPRSKLK